MKFFRAHRHAGLPLVVAATAAILILAAGCSSAPAPAQTPAPTSVSVVDPTTNTPVNFIEAVKKVVPSVVKIEVTYGPQGAPNDPLARGAAGTGWVIRGDGVIVTNNHVVDGAQTVTVTLADGTTQTMTAARTDPSKDLAVIRIAAQNLPPVTIGSSSQLDMGQPVAAIGNALNLGIRTTAGVVSQLNVPINSGGISLNGLIETDATINPGNSGGVLITALGEVVGIPSVGLQSSNLDAESFGYAISIDEAMPVINNLISQLP